MNSCVLRRSEMTVQMSVVLPFPCLFAFQHILNSMGVISEHRPSSWFESWLGKQLPKLPTEVVLVIWASRGAAESSRAAGWV